MQADLIADMAIPWGYYTPLEQGAQDAGYPDAVSASTVDAA